MLGKDQIAGIIVGSSIGIGLVLAVVLFTVVCLYNRRLQRNEHEPSEYARSSHTAFYADNNLSLSGVKRWIHHVAAAKGRAAVPSHRAADDTQRTSGWKQQLHAAHVMPTLRGATTESDNTGSPGFRYSLDSRESSPSAQNMQTSMRKAHMGGPSTRTPIDQAFDDLALELSRDTRKQTQQRVHETTPTVFPRDMPMQTMGFNHSVPTLQHPLRMSPASRSHSPLAAPPQSKSSRPSGPEKKFNPHHSRLPEGAFF